MPNFIQILSSVLLQSRCNQISFDSYISTNMVRRPIFTSKAFRVEYQFLGPVRFLWGREQAHGPIGAKLKDFQFSTRLAPVKEPMDILLYLLFILLFIFLLRLLLTPSVHFLIYLNRISSKPIINFF